MSVSVRPTGPRCRPADGHTSNVGTAIRSEVPGEEAPRFWAAYLVTSHTSVAKTQKTCSAAECRSRWRARQAKAHGVLDGR
jgi:hypothetical protein